MKPLHTSYSNFGSWKSVHDRSSNTIFIRSDEMRGILTSIFIFVFCAVWLVDIQTRVASRGGRIAMDWILGLTGLGVPAIMLAHGRSERRKGDLIRYRIHDDFLEFPRMGLSVEKARQRVWFSSEHYADGDHSFELNLVLDGERIKFLSSSAANGFRSITGALEPLGFAVRHQKIQIR